MSIPSSGSSTWRSASKTSSRVVTLASLTTRRGAAGAAPRTLPSSLVGESRVLLLPPDPEGRGHDSQRREEAGEDAEAGGAPVEAAARRRVAYRDELRLPDLGDDRAAIAAVVRPRGRHERRRVVAGDDPGLVEPGLQGHDLRRVVAGDHAGL